MKINTYFSHKKTLKIIPVSIETTIGGNGVMLEGLASDILEKEILLRVLTALQAATDIKIPASGTKTVITCAARSKVQRIDLPVAVSIYAALIKDCLIDCEGWILTGELHLDGALSPVNSSFDMLEQAKETGRKVFLPRMVYSELTDQYRQYAFPADNLREVINTLDKF